MTERASQPNRARRPRPDRDYSAWMAAEYGDVIDRLPVSDEHRAFVRDRWLSELLWYHREAGPHRLAYYGLRLVAVAGGALLPLVGTFTQAYGWNVLPIAIIGSVVALAVGLDSLFRPGDRWQHYRRSAELLKSEGWRYVALAAPYASHETHERAFPAFARRIEAFLAREVEDYAQRVMLAQGPPTDEPAGDGTSSGSTPSDTAAG